MVVTVLRILALAGIVLVGVLLLVYMSKNKGSAKVKENIEFGKKHAVYNALVALVANFFVVEGVGVHAINAIGFKLGKSIEDSNIPGTMNIGATIPCCLAAFLFVDKQADVDSITITSMVVAATVGAFLLSGVIGKLNMLGTRLLLGIGLLIMSAFILIRAFGLGNVNFVGTASGLTGFSLVIGIVSSFVFGALMNIGVGYYAPMLAICSMLGMNISSSMAVVFITTGILLAFGIGPRIIGSGKFDIVAVNTQFICGSIGVVAAYFLVLNMPINIIIKVVGFIVIVTGIMFIKDYFDGLRAAKR